MWLYQPKIMWSDAKQKQGVPMRPIQSIGWKLYPMIKKWQTTLPESVNIWHLFRCVLSSNNWDHMFLGNAPLSHG